VKVKKIFGLLTFVVAFTAQMPIASASTITTPDMFLTLPVPGTVAGPAWASMLNQAFTDIDSHDHTDGNGALIPTAGLNINASLQFNDYDIVLPRSTMYTNQGATLSTGNDKNNVYVSNGNLYFNNASGTPIQITTGSSVNTGGSGSISGMGSTTSAVTYSDLTKTFSFTQSSGVTASIGAGSYSLFENVSSANSVNLLSPTSLGSSYNWTFPAALPASTKILTISNTGAIGDTYDVDNSTLTVASNTLKVPTSGIGTTQLADASVTQTKLYKRTTGTSVSAGNVAVSNSSGGFFSGATSPAPVTNLSVTLVTTGRPVMMLLVPDGSSNPPGFTNNSYLNTSTNASDQVTIYYYRDGSSIGATNYSNSGLSAMSYAIPQMLDPSPSAGTHTYAIYGGATASFGVFNLKLVAYEL
jgi:hypothetical protein